MNVKDTMIIQAILSGKDEKALQALYKQFQKDQRLCKKNSGKLEDAEVCFRMRLSAFIKW